MEDIGNDFMAHTTRTYIQSTCLSMDGLMTLDAAIDNDNQPEVLFDRMDIEVVIPYSYIVWKIGMVNEELDTIGGATSVLSACPSQDA